MSVWSVRFPVPLLYSRGVHPLWNILHVTLVFITGFGSIPDAWYASAGLADSLSAGLRLVERKNIATRTAIVAVKRL